MAFTPPPTADPAATSGGVVVVGNAMPGGRLEWTITRRLAGATQPYELIDTLGDGQQFDAGFVPRVTAWSGGVATYTGDLTGWSLVRDAGTGASQIGFPLGAVPLAGADAVSVTFRSVIAPVLASRPLAPLLGQGDTLQNSAVLAGQAGPPDLATATLPSGVLGAAIYAVNGVVQTGAAHAAVGDAVTYRLRLRLPLSSAQQVQIVAVPPGVPGATVFDGSFTAAVPATGHAQWGPAATYTALLPSVSLDGAGGIRFQFGAVQPVYGTGASEIDILFTATLGGLGGTPPTIQATETETNAAGRVSQSTASAALALDPPRLSIQTASLYASGVTSQFAGTGGPWGFDIFTSQFGGVVSSAGLAGEPFQDRLWDVDAGDVVTFVIAIQNLAGRAAAYDVLLRDVMPPGFAAPIDGVGLSVTDGTGSPIPFTGNLFDPAGGLRLGAPLPGYDPNSGLNVALLTFTLQATARLAVPLAALSNVAQAVSYAAMPNGADVSAGVAVQASTPLTTTGIGLDVLPKQAATTLATGQQAAFDVTVTLPEGETRGLRLDEVLPHGPGAWLQLVSAEIIHVGTSLSLTGAATIQPDGALVLGTVLNRPDDTVTYGDKLVVRVTVQAAGTGGGTGVLQTVVSAADPNLTGPAPAWSQTVTSTLTLQAPNVVPTIAGARGGQNATSSMQVHPLSGLVLADPNLDQVQTLTVRLTDPTLGALGGTGGGSYDAASGTFVARGSIAAVQDAVRGLVFVAAANRTGTEGFAVTLDDGAGGVAQDGSSALRIVAPAPAAAGIQRFALSPTATVLTSTASGQQTVAQIETYQGPVSYLTSQFIYDGTDPIAIVAQAPNTFIKNVAGSAAVQLLSGQNVVDAGHGSNFLLGGTGNDVFFLDGRQAQETWDTIVGFNAGDIATLWGFRAGVSRTWWEDGAGAPGYTGRTLRADLTGSGRIEASLTFAGKSAADTARYALTTGNIQGNDYMTIFGL